MFKNYFKTACRNLYRNKGYSFITILGLAIGMTSFILISLFVFHEMSYDRYHTKADRIYRIVEDLRTENDIQLQSSSSPPMGPAFAREFPEVVGYVRFLHRKYIVRKADKFFTEKDCYLADSNVFKVFDFPLLTGNPNSALVNPRSVVLTQTAAKKYFGDSDPFGQMLEIDHENHIVTGVMADIPEVSHFRFTMLISFSTFSTRFKEEEENGWFSNGFHTYLLLADDNGAAEKLRAKIPAFIEKYTGRLSRQYGMFYSGLPLQSLTSIYLEIPRTGENGNRGSKSNLLILSLVAIFILLIACFNYVNLATARASRRTKEVGLRKLLGAERSSLLKQFLGESIVVSIVSMLFGVAIAMLLLPSFNSFTETSLSLYTAHWGRIWIALIIGSVLLGILAGSYPAVLVSGFHPLQVFRRAPGALFSNSWLRRILVSSQFIISIALITGTLLVFEQLSHLRTIDLGFDKEKTMVIEFTSGNVNKHLELMKDKFKRISGVVAVACSDIVPGESTWNSSTGVEAMNGKWSAIDLNTILVDHDFIVNYGIPVIAGRSFSRNFPGDDTTAFMINEATVKSLGWTPEKALGKQIYQEGKKGIIIGVVRDFHYQSLHFSIDPLLIHMHADWLERFSLKIKSDDMAGAIEAIGKEWKSLAPDAPFSYSFLDQDYDRLYKAEDQLGRIVRIFSGLAIFIACLGLIGLTSFSVERRFKEIGIRKVLGASAAGVVVLLSKEFMKLILISFVIAIPLTYYMVNLWLANFTDRISIGPATFVVAGLSVLLIAWLVISYLSIRAALTNPVESLRTE